MRVFFISIILSFFAGNFIQAQNPCKEGDCPPEVLSIQLDVPLKADPAQLATRTEQFKAAYLKVKNLKEAQAKTPGWSQKNKDGLLVGPSCVRMFQLEGLFAYEYEQNPQFKSFIGQQEPNIRAFRKRGFESSTKANNLEARMRNKCEKQLKKLEQDKGPSIKDLPTIYRKIGEVLKYFDEKGNLKIPSEKEEKVLELIDKLNQIPLGTSLPANLTKLGTDLDLGKAALNKVLELQNTLKPRLASLLPKPVGLLSKLGNLGKIQDALKPGLSNKPAASGLLDKLNKLISDKDNLKKELEEFAAKPKKLKEECDKIDHAIASVKDALDKQGGGLQDLQNTLADLQKKKTDLASQLKELPANIAELEKKIDDLTQKADVTKEKANTQSKEKDGLLEKVLDLSKQKGNMLDRLKQLEEQLTELEKKGENLEKDTQIVSDEAAKPDPVEAEIAKLKEKLNELKEEPIWKNELDTCEKGLKGLLGRVNPLAKIQQGLKKKLGGFLSGPSNLLANLTKLKGKQEDLKAEANKLLDKAIPVKKVEQLIATYTNINTQANQAKDNKEILTKELASFGIKLDDVTKGFNGDLSKVAELRKELEGIIGRKTGLLTRLSKPLEKIEEVGGKVKDFLEKYGLFGQKEKCKDQTEQGKKVDKLEDEQSALKGKIEELEKEIKELEKAEEELRDKTEQASNDIELKKEEEAIKEAYGKEVSLEPVSVEEWAESFEIKRPYWDAVFHPDDEVVEGMKGRYFEVRLKDAEKNVKLLFGPGKYFMEKSDFRNTYGSTIGSFVSEALHHMKKADQGKVKLFIQGSADIAGHKTFRGKLDDKYLYEEVAVLSQNADKETFSNIAIEKTIPKTNFDNTHLPDLRGNYLKEMIGIYSKKMNPILLEGAVKEVEAKGERNAIIYLFIPEELLSEYDQE